MEYNDFLGIKNDQKMIIKLRSILQIMGNGNPKEIEDEYYRKYECFNEHKKLELACNYIKYELLKIEKEYPELKDLIDNKLSFINYVLLTIVNSEEIYPEELEGVKKRILEIALSFDLNVKFHSVVGALYDEKIYSYRKRGK